MANSITAVLRFTETSHSLVKTILILFFASTGFSVIAKRSKADNYTQFELIKLENHEFRVIYNVKATSSGITYYWYTLRKGSQHKTNQ